MYGWISFKVGMFIAAVETEIEIHNMSILWVWVG